jgi:hypothetical protein
VDWKKEEKVKGKSKVTLGWSFLELKTRLLSTDKVPDFLLNTSWGFRSHFLGDIIPSLTTRNFNLFKQQWMDSLRFFINAQPSCGTP